MLAEFAMTKDCSTLLVTPVPIPPIQTDQSVPLLPIPAAGQPLSGPQRGKSCIPPNVDDGVQDEFGGKPFSNPPSVLPLPANKIVLIKLC